MKKNRESKSIITVDVYSNKIYKLVKGKFALARSLKAGKNDTVVSYVANRDLIIEPVELSRSLPQEHIVDIITDKVYEELSLDPAIEYQIIPVKTALRGDEDKYQVLIADKNSLKETLQPIAKKTKNIDLVIPAPLLYQILYKKEKLTKSSTNMFIYFGEYDTFVTFYHLGEFLYSKSIKFSLQQMYDRFCQLAQNVPLNKDQFRELLANDGLKNADDKHRELLVSVINECFLNINDVLIYTKRAYDLKNIKVAYVGFSWGYMTGIESYVSNYLNLEGKPLSSIYTKEDPRTTVDPVHALMAMNAVTTTDGASDIPNLTPYPRPAPITKRPAGKMISLFVLAILLALAPVAYDYVIGVTTQAKNTLLAKKEAKLTKLVNDYKHKIKVREDKLKKIEDELSKTSSLYNHKKAELTTVYNKKFNYKLRSEQLALITNVLKGYSIKSRFIEISDRVYKIEVESKDDKEITAFIKELVKKFNRSISKVDIKSIVYHPKEELYKGVVKIEFKEVI